LLIVESRCKRSARLQNNATSSNWKNTGHFGDPPFRVYEPVYYHSHSDTFPSSSNEEQGWWVATHVGNAFTYKIITKISLLYSQLFDQLCFQISVTSVFLHLEPLGGETASSFLGDKMLISSRYENLDNDKNQDDSPNFKQCMVTIDPQGFFGQTFFIN
jgi:hypothetical protein